MDFRILGPIEVVDADRPLALGGSKQRALLGMLLLHANEVVSSDRLIEELWAGERREDGIRALQVAVSRLRKALAADPVAAGDNGLVVTRSPGYELRVDPERLDFKRFEAHIEEGRRLLASDDPAAARAELDAALGLWRGPPLTDLAYESFCQAEIARLEELRLEALEHRLEADLALGRHGEVVGELDGLVAQHPLRERLRMLQMLALYRCARQAEALDAFQSARAALVDELGIEPSRELRDLHGAILRQDPALELTQVEPAVAAPRVAFVGREAELGTLMAGLDGALAGRGGLILVTGEPGIGKSRLAEELISRARARGARVLVGRCWEAGGAPAYWPWVQALRAYVREADGDALRAQLGGGAAVVAQLVTELRERLPDLPEPPAAESDVARFRLFDAVAEFLRSASESRPLVLVLDDRSEER